MATASPIPILAQVSGGEQDAIVTAAELLGAALSKAAGAAFAVGCTFVEPGETLAPTEGPCILVTSLVPEVERAEEPWPETEARLRAWYEALCQDPANPVFVCTVFRHVARDLPSEEVARRRVRIRRLNFLALELSRERGLMVADVDRDLADVGAQAFETDYRLGGPYAAAAAGKSIAMALAHVGLDEFAPFAVQEAARELVRAYQPPQAGHNGGAAPLKIGGYVRTVRARQRVQTVEYAEEPVDDAIAASQVKRLLSGRIGVRDAAAMLSQAVAKRGVWGSAALVVSGLKRVAGDARARR